MVATFWIAWKSRRTGGPSSRERGGRCHGRALGVPPIPRPNASIAGRKNMANAITHTAFDVTASPTTGTMQIAQSKDGINLGSVEINTKEASQIAAIVLGNARDAYNLSGKPPPYSSKDQKICLTAISPSGYSIGSGRKPESILLILHFGDTALDIELLQSELPTFPRRLMTLAADEKSAQ